MKIIAGADDDEQQARQRESLSKGRRGEKAGRRR
jgi:hypothetical protein